MADSPEGIKILRMTYDLNVTSIDAEQAEAMVSKLGALPNHDIYNGGRGYIYDDVIWKNDVLPAIGGSTKNYQERITHATKAFLDFGQKYGLTRTFPLPNNCRFGGDQLMFDAWKLPAELRPRAKELFDTMVDIAMYHSTYLGEVHTWIQSESEDTEDGRLTSFATGLGARLCFIENAEGDGYCYGYDADPHVKEISLNCIDDD